jgi:hypothetical protein
MNASTDKLNPREVEMKSMYNIWKGNNKFFFNGKLYAG